MVKKNIEKFLANCVKARLGRLNSIPAAGKVYDSRELENLIQAALEGWWTEGKWNSLFEEKLKKFLNIKFVHTCNSGSSANFLAFSALCSSSLGSRRIKKGDEVITVAASFPTTINPILQNGCVPTFVDVDIPTYNINVQELRKALSPKTKAVVLAHTLGNPFNLKAVQSFCKKNKLWLIEDNCDALGSKYNGQYTGTFGDFGTLSFYPAHHITTAEGGAVITNNAKLAKIVRSLRDWGKHCWCPTGQDNTCKKRYSWKLGHLPEGYDHKYIYSELGYNLKLSDLHAAIGVAQMGKLKSFIKKRQENFAYLHKKFQKFKNYFFLPKATANSKPSWFGFPLAIKEDTLQRADLLKYLMKNKIGTRLLFGGNIIRQPYFTDNPELHFRVIGNLRNTDFIMNNVFWIGVYPAITPPMIDKITNIFEKFLKK